jgi:hypothetical protein
MQYKRILARRMSAHNPPEAGAIVSLWFRVLKLSEYLAEGRLPLCGRQFRLHQALNGRPSIAVIRRR